MDIFSKKGKLDITDDKTNIVFAFNVPYGVEKLFIDYSYFPKQLENEHLGTELTKKAIEKFGITWATPQDYLPLSNLITLSIDDESSYRGAAHRQSPSQHHEISGDKASPGFISGKINPGEWKICLNVHCATCPIDYEIKITGEGK